MKDTKDIRVMIRKERTDKNSFLVTMIGIPSLPDGVKRADFSTECAVIGVGENDDGEYGGCELSPQEKEVIGDKITNMCLPMNEWFWCNLFESTMTPKDSQNRILFEVSAERDRQDNKWGVQHHDELKWLIILGKEVREANTAVLENIFDDESLDNYRKELIQVAAVAVAMVESYDMRAK